MRGRPRPLPLPFALLLIGWAAAVAPAAGAATDTVGWPQFGRTAQHLNVNPDEQAFTPRNVARLRVAWTDHYGDGSTSEGGPVVAGGFAYIAGFDGDLSAFKAAGCGAASCAPLWKGHTDNGISGSPAVAGGLVLVGSADHFLYAFPAAGCGAAICPPRWKGRLADAVLSSSVALADGIAYVGDFGGRLYAFKVAGCGAAVCRALWTGVAGPNEALTSSPAVGHGSVFIGSFINTPEEFTGRMLVFPSAGCGRRTCAPTWTADIGGPANRTASPLVSGETVFMGSSTNFGGVDGAHLFAFPAGGCGRKTCAALRAYDVGDGGIETTPALVGNTLYASTQATPDPNTIGVVAAFPANGCGRALCPPRWTGVNFASGFESSPVVAGNVVFVGKGPASGVPVDACVYAFDARGCGAAVVCQPLTFAQFGPDQFYLGSSIAVTGGRVMLGSNDNTDGRSNLYVLSLLG
jgi:outer membrane protein assembly factor BamB